jgi:hypothetical protein
VSDLLAYEQREGLRQRVRKPADAAAMRNAVHVIVANLAHAVPFPSEEGSAIILPLANSRGKPVEPVPDGFSKGLPAIVEGLHAGGMLTLRRPDEPRLATTIAPASGFRMRMLAAGVHAGDLGRRVVLNRLRLSRREKDGPRTFFPIPDTEEASGLRDQLDMINAGLAGAALAYMGNAPVDVGDRMLVRCFNLPAGITAPCLDYGGRLAGGFWMNMPKSQRQHIRIGGEAVVELDYGQVFPRLAFGLVGSCPPDVADLYHLPELDAEPGGPYRDGVKQGFNALLWGTKRWTGEIVAALPRGWPASRLRSALVVKYPVLADLLRPGSKTAGYRLLYLESTIMVAVLLTCMAEGIVALPIHDAVLAPASAVDTVREIMEQSALPANTLVP